MQEEEEAFESATTRLPGCSRSARICHSTGISSQFPQGSYYPNYQTHNNIITGLSRPCDVAMGRDTSLDSVFTPALHSNINSLLGATGIVYAGSGGLGTLDGRDPWRCCSAGTFWLLEHNGHLVGVTALHTFRLPAPIKLYINVSADGSLKSERASFSRQEVHIPDFIEVHLRQDLLDIREQYIRQLHTSLDVETAAHNIDPDFQLQYAITCDIAFIDLEPHRVRFAGRPRLQLASDPVAVNAWNVAIGYHYSGPWKQKDLEEEFAATPIKTPLAGTIYYAEARSVSLGVVQNVGTGLITEQSSGSPKLVLENGQFRVFGISVGAFNDQPSLVAPPDWTLRDPPGTSNIFLDIQLPEPGRTSTATPKNRNVILSFRHPCVVDMLAAI